GAAGHRAERGAAAGTADRAVAAVARDLRVERRVHADVRDRPARGTRGRGAASNAVAGHAGCARQLHAGAHAADAAAVGRHTCPDAKPPDAAPGPADIAARCGRATTTAAATATTATAAAPGVPAAAAAAAGHAWLAGGS